jgi:hypothetical protein
MLTATSATIAYDHADIAALHNIGLSSAFIRTKTKQNTLVK